jgi:hypothetical protein
MGNGLISWFWNILGKDDDFELWLVTWWFWVRYFRRSVVDLWKKSRFKVEDDGISVWSINLWKL